MTTSDETRSQIQIGDGLSALNPSPMNEIIRRGQEALERKRQGFEDWMDIAEALEIGRAESMQKAGTNKPTGRHFEKAHGAWLRAHGFHLIDKATRHRALKCRENRSEIEKYRATLTDEERLRVNSPDANLRGWKAWKAKTGDTKTTAPRRTSAITKLKAANVELQDKLDRAQRELDRGGGDLWNADDRAEDIANIMLAKLTASKAERVARAMLIKLNEQKKAQEAAKDAAESAEERKALYADEIESPTE